MFHRFLAVSAFCFSLAFATPGWSQEAADDGVLKTDLALPYLVHLPEHAKHAPLIVLLHGRGSNERDLYAMRGDLPSQYVVASARGPQEIIPGRYEWFEEVDSHGRLDGKPQELASASALIERLVRQLVTKYDLDPKRVYLVGFSQGAIMSYEVGLTDPSEFRGIGVMSGAFFGSLVPQVRRSPELDRLRVFISHGADDPVVTPDYEGEALSRLNAVGVSPQFHLYPGMVHEINPEALHDLVAWLQAD